MPSLFDIGESIEARIVQARHEIAALEAARAALRENGTPKRARTAVRGNRSGRGRRPRPAQPEADGNARKVASVAAVTSTAGARSTRGAAASAAGPSRKPRARANPAQKRPVVLLAGKLEAMLRDAADGLSVAAIVKDAGARDSQVRTLLRELEGAGQVRRTGVGRGTRWRLVTDEDPIAERAAELEKLSQATA